MPLSAVSLNDSASNGTCVCLISREDSLDSLLEDAVGDGSEEGKLTTFELQACYLNLKLTITNSSFNKWIVKLMCEALELVFATSDLEDLN